MTTNEPSVIIKLGQRAVKAFGNASVDPNVAGFRKIRVLAMLSTKLVLLVLLVALFYIVDWSLVLIRFTLLGLLDIAEFIVGRFASH